MPKVLVVDDDRHIRDVVAFALRKEGFAVAEAGDGAAALQAAEQEKPDLLVLDILMPEMDGTEVCRRLRASSAVPIIFLSSKDDEIDRVVGLELGGDDYVTKPFSPRELVARVKAVLRRRDGAVVGTPPAPPPAVDELPPHRVLRRGLLALDLDAHAATWDGTAIELTATEFAMLRTLAERPGKVFTRDNLMERAYDDRRFVSDRTIDSHVRRIRAKLAAAGGAPIETVHGVGYKLTAAMPAP
ncbi:response regulator transcription factor [Vineibacter terrae]|uniref:response regulator transcription factor n=1 Tax=Vineibacter terrae TaxID=2586908 RepID=UPI002E319374|nr:response regulator transcription factor [Vineibacter terrae]HEX2891619.1 response regulator transcription factor [Vineibacter terrae]